MPGLLRLAAAGGLMVGLSDAIWRTLGVDEDGLIVGPEERAAGRDGRATTMAAGGVMGKAMIKSANVARILYFGSRTWLDVPVGMSYDETRYAIRRRGEVPLAWRGPRFGTLLDVMRADVERHGRIVVIEGEADGWDILSRIIAQELDQEVDPYPVNTALDGPWPAAGPRRNERMARDGRPFGARGGVTGPVSSPLSRGSASMARILQRQGIPMIIHRDDGIVTA